MQADYPANCPIGRTLNLIGDRWTLMILRDFMLCETRKFSDFQHSFPALGPNTLSARLKTLEDARLIKRRFYEDHPPRAEYVLTAKGRSLAPVLRALLDWGVKHTR